MRENPFKIIGSTEEPREDLRKEVLGSVRLAVLMMRFAQLFVADYASVLFDKFKVIPGDNETTGQQGLPPKP
ncbi:MAG: hypothetical protein KDC00_09060 [Flavobacteriales bacterium]|nr:hypothetical protein [Flavobacteriales bacterium]